MNKLIVQKKDGENDKYETSFNNTDSYVRWEDNLFNRQKAKLLPNERLPLFLYPTDNWSVTYNADKRPGYTPPVGGEPDMSVVLY